MEVKANLKNLRIAPRKVRLLADLVRGSEINKALDQIAFSYKKSAEPVAKLIKSAVANAVHNFDLDKDNLFIKEIRVDEGKKLKRWMPKAHGRATPIRKRSSHIIMTLGEIKDSGVKQAKKQTIEAPVDLTAIAKKGEDKKAKKEETKQEAKPKEQKEEKGKVINDPRMEGRRGHVKLEGGTEKGFIKKVFQRKSG